MHLSSSDTFALRRPRLGVWRELERGNHRSSTCGRLAAQTRSTPHFYNFRSRHSLSNAEIIGEGYHGAFKGVQSNTAVSGVSWAARGVCHVVGQNQKPKHKNRGKLKF